MIRAIEKIILGIFGCHALILINDPPSFDRFRWLRRKLRRGNLKTLDAGCGSGALTIYAAKQGNAATGVSFNESKNAIGKRRAGILGLNNINFITANLHNLGAEGERLGKFDQIICFETIEHIMDDKKLLKDFSDLLVPGGRLLLTTPYKHYRPFPGDAISEVEDGGHVRWGYTFEEMSSLLAESGLKVREEKYVSGVISQRLLRMTQAIDTLFVRLGWLVVFPLRVFQIFDRPLTALLKYPYFTICVEAEKI